VSNYIQTPKGQNLWNSRDELLMLQKLAGTMGIDDIAKKLNSTFNKKRTGKTVKAKAHKHSISLAIKKVA
jgi:hypothetical protein